MGGPSETQDCHRHPELKRKIYSALQESDEGELSIAIPAEVALKHSSHSSTGISFPNDVSTPEPQTPGFNQSNGLVPEFSPIVVHIAYSLRNPVDGFEFVLPSDAYPFRVPHAYTSPTSPDSARCWVPCLDNLWEKCTWEFEFVVPRYLEERDLQNDDDELSEASPTIVVCSGELVEQVAHPYNSNKTIFLFSQAVLTSVQHIAFAAGPFHLLSIPPDNIAEEPSGSSQPLMYAFCLPGQEQLLSSSTTCLRSAMTFYTSECGSYPFGSYKIVFVDQLPTQRFDSATLSIVTTDLLHGEDALEQAIETRHALGHALACQWAGINIIPKSWSDLWLVNGLALYITGLFMRKLFGNNDYRFRLKKDMQRVVDWDMGGMPPICQPQVLDPPDSVTLPFINLKAPLVLHILDRRLGKSGTSLGLSRVLPKLFLSAISGELQNNALSTHTFLRTCRKVSGVDPRSFAEQWIYGSGCPSFSFSASFNRKKMAVEITMRQEAPAHSVLENNEISKLLMKPVPFFEGQMTIRIHEADGTPYEHVLDIRSPFKRYEVPFNTKYKRVRRNTKRYLARQAAAQAAAEGDAEAAEAMGMVDMSFGLDIWEKEQERENWKVADWTEEDEGIMSGATYEWIRMDADFEWIANIKFEQPDFMWVSQLQRDRDVVAQLEAVNALAEKPTAIVSSTLTKTVLVSSYYFRIRCEAATALVNCAVRKLDFLGLFHLFKLFLRYCYDPEDPNQDLFSHKYVPKPNDFSDLSEYFVRKSLVTAISQVRFENGKTPSVVRQFFIDQLRYNDNTSNPYSDGFYISTIISAAAHANVSTAPPERGELLPSETRTEYTAEDMDLVKQTRTEVDRYRSMDRLIPSPHNIVTISALEFYMMLGIANLVPSHPRIFFPFTREGNFTQVRIAAFDGLFLTKWYTPQIMRYILAVMANDPSKVVKRHVARNACYSLALLVQMGEMKSTSKEAEALLIEEDGNSQEKAKESKRSEMETMIKVLRKDREVGKNEILREFLMPIALNPDLDHEVRWCILKLADLLIRPVEESPPSVKIHIPSTPVLDTAPMLPAVKVPPKVPRVIKSGGPPIKSPLVTLNPPTKLKLPASPMLESTSLKPLPPTPVPEAPKKVVNFAKPDLPPKVPKSLKARPSTTPAPVHSSTSKVAKVTTKPAHVPKAQSGGMSLNDLKATRAALKKLKSNKHAVIFLQPVDPIRDHAPNYFNIIKDPMDLGTMGAKLEEGLYKDRFAFQADFKLMVNNAKLYNVAGSFVHNEAIILETIFEKQWAVINKTLAATDNARPPPPIPAASSPPVVQAPKPQPRIISASRTPAPPPSAPSPAERRPEPQRNETTSSVASTSRPMIKLKVASQSKASVEPNERAPDNTKPLKRKSKPSELPTVLDAPPPPYVDDGSHDILQEVLAIEREKNEQRHRISDRERPESATSSGKRRKLDVEEDILALAATSKKERPTPPGPSNNIKIHKNSPVSTPRPSEPPAKPKKDRLAESSNTSRSSVPIDQPLPPSLKGKEREVSKPSPSSTPTPAPQNKPRKPTQTTPINVKKCKELMKVLCKLPESGIFLRPVDIVLDGCPTYYDEIENPMDFGTISSKLNDGRYVTMEEFKADVELVFSNCRQFNPPGTSPTIIVAVVEKVFRKEWPKAMERKLSWTEKRGLQGVLNTLSKDPMCWIFQNPVDPIALGIPTYFDVIPKKDARDLKTIRQKLDTDKYDSVEAFEADVELMFHNAIKFNGIDSEVGVITVSLREQFRTLVAGWKSGPSKKRKEGDHGTPQPVAKKLKTG
ncbi:Transcription initiation factor TFIID subunit 2 [Psilocybe cubensis]|uniref:Transcription initiation factor TFIID subunit 2 n=2 Tax=Psilocybe cubensis TaxID=181762 RepID=A0A8H8CQ86_PSICU|nr:Transcription initiation factor TFIID subunit 2 [Psilocybe cubensis]KAH9486347.1 Transcription initiation factor TFIID subunit 2 [Psilocybe cubensis]